MSNKNNRRPARPANRSALKGDLARNDRRREEQRREERLDRASARFIELFTVVAPVAERMADKLVEFAQTEAGVATAERTDKLVRDAASSVLGQRALGAAVAYIERGIECEAAEGEARSRAEVARIEREAEAEPKPEPKPALKGDLARKLEPKPALKGDLARKLEEAQANLLSARQSLIDEMRMHEAKARELRKELERDNKRY